MVESRYALAASSAYAYNSVDVRCTTSISEQLLRQMEGRGTVYWKVSEWVWQRSGGSGVGCSTIVCFVLYSRNKYAFIPLFLYVIDVFLYVLLSVNPVNSREHIETNVVCVFWTQ